jgi:acetylornithine/succinyldiaminopimelate/putrescine aminotransferase
MNIMDRLKYQEYKQWAERDTLTLPFREMLKSNKEHTYVIFPCELMDFLLHEANEEIGNNEDSLTEYISEQLLKLIHLSLVFADERGIGLNELRSYDLAEIEQVL